MKYLDPKNDLIFKNATIAKRTRDRGAGVSFSGNDS
jgi:hypothetical protein